MAKKSSGNQLDLFRWADERRSTVVDRVDFFKIQKMRTRLWRKRVELGVYGHPVSGEVVVIERRA